MSHRWNCPDRRDAERDGERAYDRGVSRLRNPYDTFDPRERCDEAVDAWRDGYRRAEMRDEEEREENAARQRAARQRAELAAEELYDYPPEDWPL